jgi:hypothetical protein
LTVQGGDHSVFWVDQDHSVSWVDPERSEFIKLKSIRPIAAEAIKSSVFGLLHGVALDCNLKLNPATVADG